MNAALAIVAGAVGSVVTLAVQAVLRAVAARRSPLAARLTYTIDELPS